MVEIKENLASEPIEKPPTQVVEVETVKDPIAVKPPTQGVGVAGFKADLYASDIKQSEEISKIEWHILIHLPKFQMYAVEVAGIKYGHVGNVMEWIVGWMQDCIQSNGEKWFFDAYLVWHDEKGYWKQEDYYGQLIGES